MVENDFQLLFRDHLSRALDKGFQFSLFQSPFLSFRAKLEEIDVFVDQVFFLLLHERIKSGEIPYDRR
jgi:hypothetical protein